MSEGDRTKWDARYRTGAYVSRPHPSAFLEACADLLPARGRALDLACGTGRNAQFLARRGLTVDAVDISPVALARGRAAAADLPIRWMEHDLDDGFEPDQGFDVIVNVRFVNLPLLAGLIASLRPHGLLIVEQHLVTDDPTVVGPRHRPFRVAPRALARVADSLSIERLYEGIVEDPDGRRAALAQLAARRQ